MADLSFKDSKDIVTQESDDSLQVAYHPSSSKVCFPPAAGGTRREKPRSEKCDVFVSTKSPRIPTKDKFEGIMLDNGASGTPSGLPAYLRYCEHVGIEPSLRPSNTSFVGLGKGIVRSLGVTTVRMPLGDSMFLDFETDVVEQDVPLMFGLDQHHKHGCSSDEYHNTFTHHPTGTTIPVKFKQGHLFVEWPTHEVLFTKTELKKLHERFGHPTAQALIDLLKRARPEDCDAETNKVLKSLVSRCKTCQTFAPKPAVYKVSWPVDEIVFNHEIEVDLFWIEGKAVLYIIDRGTRYSVARFIESQTAEYLWNVIIETWVTIFTGFPNVISHDRGSQFESEFFKDACAEFGIVAKVTPTESHNSLSLCERYHPIMRRIFRKIRSELHDLSDRLVLSLATHAVNTNTGPNGLTPSLLVFGAMPKLPLGSMQTIQPSQRDRFEAMKLAKEEMLKITAERRIATALKSRQTRVQAFVPQEGDKVRVFRENSGTFEGPYSVHSYDQRKTIYLEVPDAAGRTK